MRMGLFSRKPPVRDEERIKALLVRGVEEVFPRDHLEAALRSGKRLRVKLGFDPTGDKIHIGRAIILRKLREFQDLGHTAVFIVGDFTARIGDPSDKLEKRPMLSEREVRANLKSYKAQVGKIIDLSRAEFYHNSSWLGKLCFREIAELAESFSVQQMSNRRNFKERFDRGDEVSLREFLYPLIQGYDSVAVKADVEIGGFDQLFNLKAGRIIERHYGMPEQDILTTAMLLGTDGRKMSTSWGNVINISDSPSEMFGKVMSVRDDLIISYFTLCTATPEAEIRDMGSKLQRGELNPKDAKVLLGKRIVELYHGVGAAERAEQDFVTVFSRGGVPDDAPKVLVRGGEALSDILVNASVVASKSEFRRLVSEGAIEEVGKGKITDVNFSVSKSGSFRIGKHRFVVLEER